MLEAENGIFEQLRDVSLFDPLTDEETHSLASRARVERYFTGEVVMRQGEAGDSLYIIDEGSVTATVPTQFVVIDKEAFRKTLLQNPRIAEQISETLAARREQREANLAALHEGASQAPDEEKGQILSRIWEFFGFRAGARL